ncbi:MAG TPA: sodium:solute symporter [Burkholderiaceae bacterium]|nr:sodium:solute symporter [Burkholderiaceae bacterium]
MLPSRHATRRALRAALAALLALASGLFGATGARADSLTTIREGTLPPLSTRATALLSLDGRLLALAPGSAAVLSSDESSGTTPRWSAVDWKPTGLVLATTTTGSGRYAAAYVLSGTPDGRLEHIARLMWRGDRLEAQSLAPPPAVLRSPRAAAVGDTLVVAGITHDGQIGAFELPRPGASTGTAMAPWHERAAWPGGGAPSALVAQTSALFAVVASTAKGVSDRVWRWSVDTGWVAKGDVPGRIVAGSGRAIGQAHVLFLVQPPATNDADAAPAQLMSLHTITGAWATLPAAPAAGAGASAAWKNGIAWAVVSDSADGTATTTPLHYAEIESGQLLLKWLDWIVIAVYLVGMLGIGLYFYLREKRNSTSDFFVGGRAIPFWAAGVSLYAANTSSISYIAIPAKAFETNWQYMTNNLIAVLGLMFVAVWIVPLLRRLDLMSVFSYLETRFHPAIRMLASGLFMLTQLGSRMSVILFLPSLAIATITGIDVVWSILLMGGFTIVYTAMGGMKAVIWTDVVQLVVKMGGALFAIAFMVWALPGGASEFVSTALAEHKTRLFDFSFDLTKATVWGFIFLVLFDVVLTFPKDQVLMQRTLSTSSDKNAGRSIWAFAAIMIPGGFVFYTIGTALFVYYKAHPERLNPLLTIDATFPLFIAAELPMGVTGLIIAGIFAAAMATLSSIMNSVATLASVDFYEKLVKQADPKKSVRFAEGATVAAGLVGIGFALLLSRYDIHSLFDVSIELAGLLGGGFAGAYTLGMFTRRANSQGVAIGVAASIVLTTTAWTFKLVHPYFYLAISILLCIVIGYGASLLFPAPRRSLKGLTIYADRSADADRNAASAAERAT